MRILLSVVVAFLLQGCGNEQSQGTSKRELISVLESAVSEAQTQSEILKMLSKLSIEHSTPKHLGDTIHAIIRDVDSDGVVTTSYSMKFTFENNGTLADYSREFVHTGP